jgi:hypothetical protein
MTPGMTSAARFMRSKWRCASGIFAFCRLISFCTASHPFLRHAGSVRYVSARGGVAREKKKVRFVKWRKNWERESVVWGVKGSSRAPVVEEGGALHLRHGRRRTLLRVGGSIPLHAQCQVRSAQPSNVLTLCSRTKRYAIVGKIWSVANPILPLREKHRVFSSPQRTDRFRLLPRPHSSLRASPSRGCTALQGALREKSLSKRHNSLNIADLSPQQRGERERAYWPCREKKKEGTPTFVAVFFLCHEKERNELASLLRDAPLGGRAEPVPLVAERGSHGAQGDAGPAHAAGPGTFHPTLGQAV